MSTVDYPDWRRVDQQVDQPLMYDDISYASPAGYTGPLLNVGQWGALFFLFTNIDQNGSIGVAIEYYNDEAMTLFLGQHQWVTHSAKAIIGAVQPLGPWARVRVGMLTVNPLTNALVILSPRRDLTRLAGVSDAAILAFGAAVSVPALSSSVVTSAFCVQSEAQLCVTTNAVNWSAGVNIGATTAFPFPLCVVGAGLSGAERQSPLVLPTTLSAIILNNGDALARTFYYSLVLSPG